MPYPYSQPHTIFEDNLSDVAYNIAYWIAQAPLPGYTPALRTRTVASIGPVSNTETLLLATPLTLPSAAGVTPATLGTLNVGTLIRWTIQGTTTDTVANTTTFTIRMGTAGTVAGDTAVATFVTSASGTAGTAVPFTAVINLTVQTLTAAGTGTGQLVINSPTTGIIGAAISFNVGSAAAITALTTTTATFIDLTAVTAASTTANTFQSVQCEIFP